MADKDVSFSMLRRLFYNEYVLVFLFCLAVIQGPAYSLMDNYDITTNVDCMTYTGVARLQLNQSPIRRYRPIVPALAGSINYVFGRAINKLHPISFPGDFPLSVSFLIVNCVFVSLWGVMIYRLCRAYGLGIWESITGLLVMLTCRWTPYIAGTPMADSLYALVLAMALLGIKEKKENLIVWAIFLGPFAKEAFLFVAPVIFFFSSVPKMRQLGYFLLSGILVFSFRYAYDRIGGFPLTKGLQMDMEHITYIGDNLRTLLSFHGAYDIWSNFGVWIVLPLVALWLAPDYKKLVKEHAHWYMAVFMLSIFIHIILSGFPARMFYLSMPLICLFTGMAAQALRNEFATGKK